MNLTTFRYANPTKLLIEELQKRLPDVVVTILRPGPDERPVEKVVFVQLIDTSSSASPTQQAEVMIVALAGTYDEIWDIMDQISVALVDILASPNPIVYLTQPRPFAEQEVEDGYIMAESSVVITMLPIERIETPLY